MQRKTLLSLSLLVLLGFIWGSGYSLAKIAMEQGVPPLGYSFWQSLGPALLLSLLCVKHYKTLFNKQLWPYFFICGLIGIAIPNTNMYYVASHLPAGLLSVIVNTVPIMTYPLALAVGQERFHWQRLVAILLGTIGIIMLVSPSLSLPTIHMHPWALTALISPLSFACCSIYIAAKSPPKANPLISSAGMLLCSAFLLTPLIIKNHAFYPLTGPFTLGKQVVVLEILLSSIGYIVFFQLIRVAGPVFYSLTGGMVAITGLFWGYTLFDEILSIKQCIPIVLILIGIALLSRQQKRYNENITSHPEPSEGSPSASRRSFDFAQDDG